VRVAAGRVRPVGGGGRLYGDKFGLRGTGAQFVDFSALDSCSCKEQWSSGRPLWAPCQGALGAHGPAGPAVENPDNALKRHSAVGGQLGF
jgi:hypothetical protein